MKDLKGTKPKNETTGVEVEEARESIEDLSAIFSVTNFPSEEEIEEKVTMKEDDMDLDIGKTSFPSMLCIGCDDMHIIYYSDGSVLPP